MKLSGAKKIASVSISRKTRDLQNHAYSGKEAKHTNTHSAAATRIESTMHMKWSQMVDFFSRPNISALEAFNSFASQTESAFKTVEQFRLANMYRMNIFCLLFPFLLLLLLFHFYCCYCCCCCSGMYEIRLSCANIFCSTKQLSVCNELILPLQNLSLNVFFCVRLFLALLWVDLLGEILKLPMDVLDSANLVMPTNTEQKPRFS